MLKKISAIIENNFLELTIIFIILTVSGLAHGFNMFHYPYLENDEGTYMAQSWSVVTQGKLAPYTYWYDHPPAGWFFISIWELISGGFFRFGLSVDSGRVFMLIIQIFSTLLVYLIAKKLGGWKAGILASVIYAFSPLGIYLHRRVLLDNIMTFWLLLSLVLLLAKRVRLTNVVLSALAFGLAVLTKEPAIVFFPVFLYFIYKESRKENRSFALALWFFITGFIASFYVLYAVLKGEFFPANFFIGGGKHVSLVETLMFQFGRQGSGSVFNLASDTWSYIRQWYQGDKIIIVGGAAAMVLNLVLGFKRKPLRHVALFSLIFTAFLLRGGLLIGYYIIPLLPFLAINIGVFTAELSSIRYIEKASWVIVPALAILVSRYNLTYNKDLWTQDQTRGQVEAIAWAKKNLPPDSILLIDNYAYVDLYSSFPKAFSLYSGAQYYWKVDRDPEIKDGLLGNSWENINYLLVTPQVLSDMTTSGLALTKTAYDHSSLMEQFPSYGWQVSVYRVNKPTITAQG